MEEYVTDVKNQERLYRKPYNVVDARKQELDTKELRTLHEEQHNITEESKGNTRNEELNTKKSRAIAQGIKQSCRKSER